MDGLSGWSDFYLLIGMTEGRREEKRSEAGRRKGGKEEMERLVRRWRVGRKAEGRRRV